MALPKELMEISIEEYLALEEKSEVRHEYVPGYVFAMSGATDAHNIIISQDEKRIEIYRRDERGKTRMQVLGSNDEVTFESLPNGSMALTMDEIYEDVIFAQPLQPSED
jgi:Uma2 family endonuclease